jgi:hypothetical protein
MTPGERAVIAAAERWADNDPAPVASSMALSAAVDALIKERVGVPEDQRQELDITYGQVVEGDEIHSAKLDKWFAVSASVRLASGKQRVTMPATGSVEKGRKPWHEFDADKPCRVRRGLTGQAVDLFATVMWSGPSMVAAVDTAGGPTFADHDPASDPEASESED